MSDQKHSIEINNISKQYSAGKKSSFYALKNINIKLIKGKSLGIIGSNGSGKSTLLKIISGITSPSEGKIVYHGTLLSIIDIGSGFHLELSGRDNISLYSAFLGSSNTINQKNIQNIIEFSELDAFIDIPVKYYSNGMYLRLAFSIAFYTSVDILLLDEIVSVGDQAFMTKCYEKIEQLRKKNVALLFVSHNLSDIYKYTDLCVWLDKGEIKEYGSSNTVISNYQMSQYESIFKKKNVLNMTDLSSYSNQYIHIENLRIYQSKEKNGDNEFSYENDLFIECTYWQDIEDGYTDLVYTIYNVQMLPVYLTSSILSDYKQKILGKQKIKVTCKIPAQLLNIGYYNISIRFMKNDIIDLLYLANAYTFKITTFNERLIAKLITTSISISAINEWNVESV